MSETDEFRISEIIFSLGVIHPAQNKEAIMSVLADPKYKTSKPAGRALTQLRSALTLEDVDRIREWKEFYRFHKYPDDPTNRLEQYCDYYLVYVRSKFASS